MEYKHRDIEQKWQQFWEQNQTFKVDIDHTKPKYYVLDMFPYPSGAGLHVGHPLGYIASDIVARYKRLKGFNVLHPMGFDSFGLPAEQYAIQTGQHPAITTEQNIKTFTEQLKKIGLSYDWSREVRTSDPNYYKWTQWIFMQLFNHYYDIDVDKSLPVSDLVEKFAKGGSTAVNAVTDEDTPDFTADEWNDMTEEQQQLMLLKYRLTFPEESYVNWCPGLGTVLSNDEVKDGVSERGGFPVERKLMKQWSMRITAYADRLLSGLDTVDWPEPLKEQQRNWIGRSVGASVRFNLSLNPSPTLPDREGENLTPKGGGKEGVEGAIEVFTTRVDTIYGASFMVLAPEHELVAKITTPEQKGEVEAYIKWAASRSEVERMAEKKVSGAFTGGYCINPVNGEKVPIFIADYVLAGYGTGAVMGVPSGDQRDWLFATHFGLPIIPILDAQQDIDKQADATKEGRYINSGMINGMAYKEATEKLIKWLEENKIGKGKVQYRLRNAVFSRQRYWGEPVPAYFKGDVPYLIDEKDLPLELPKIDKYLPTETGEPPLGRAENWVYKAPNNLTPTLSTGEGDNLTASAVRPDPSPTGKGETSPSQKEKGQGDEVIYPLELSTMPGWAGSSWYWYRYMDPQNNDAFASQEAIDYWQRVDFYLGGSEHATGHLLYSRFWNKFLKDLGLVPHEEYAAKLVNQGMIQGVSQFAYCLKRECFMYKEIDNQEVLVVPTFYGEEIVYQITGQVEEIWYSIDLIEKIQKVYPKLEFYSQRLPISYIKSNADYTNNEVDIVTLIVKNSHRFDKSIFVVGNGYWESGGVGVGGRFNYYDRVPNIFYTYSEVEKMSKSKYNVVNPDTIVEKYGADTLRLYEMFLGPLTEAKPWNTNGITGTYSFLRKFWRLFYDEQTGKQKWNEEPPTPAELKVLHRTIKRVEEDLERLSFNTVVSTFMIAVNELTDLKCHKRAILEPMIVLLSPYSPHIAEELWEKLGNAAGTALDAPFPTFDAKYLVESSFDYPIQINGKVRANISFPADMTPADIEQGVLANETVQKWLEGNTPKKVVVVPKRIVNVVI